MLAFVTLDVWSSDGIESLVRSAAMVPSACSNVTYLAVETAKKSVCYTANFYAGENEASAKLAPTISFKFSP